MKLLIFAAILLATGCSMNSRYNVAHDLYMDSNYPTAIEHYDNFLDSHPEGAFATRAELERSDCYYQLGYKAYSKENWILASRLLYLSNSSIADGILDECYKELAIIAMVEQDTTTAMEHYKYIIQYLTDSELVPEMLFNRISVFLSRNKNLTAFKDYHKLWLEYPDSDFRKNVQPKIDVLLPDFMQEALILKSNRQYEDALDICFRLSQYPSKLQNDIITEIGDIYWLLAESEAALSNLQTARKFFDKVIEYCPTCKTRTFERLEELCQEFITEGINLELLLKFDEAVVSYQQCYKLIPDHTQAASSIENAIEAKARYLDAMSKMYAAEEQERIKEHKKALILYEKSNKLFATKEANEKIFIMKNILEAEKNPKDFAHKIVTDYQNGLLVKCVTKVEDFMFERYGDVIKPSGWKVTYSLGLYKYEVRYDILSTFGNFYFAWRVNLKTRAVAPSNKISELVVTDIDEVLSRVE